MKKGRGRQRKTVQIRKKSAATQQPAKILTTNSKQAADSSGVANASISVVPQNMQPQGGARKPQIPASLPSRWRGYRAALGRWLRRPTSWFAIIAGLLSIGQAALRYKPNVDIFASVNLDAGDMLGTEFQFENTGVLPLHNVKFGCLIEPDNNRFEGNIPGQEPIDYMPWKAVVTRSCAFRTRSGPLKIGISDPSKATLTVYIEYSPPLTEKRMTNKIRFTSRYNSNLKIYILVRDDIGAGM